MKEERLKSIYSMVCETPKGIDFHIEHMPQFFDTDPMDNSIPHVHTFYEIIWFEESGGHHSVDFQDYEVEADSIFFLSPGQVHHFDGVTRHKGILLKFCTDFLKANRDESDAFIRYGLFDTFDAAPYHITTPDIKQQLHQLTGHMEQEMAHPQAFGHLDMLRSLTRIFLTLVQRHGQRQHVMELGGTRPSLRLFAQFRHLLEQEYDHLHTVGDYATRLNVSDKTLSNSLSECSGKTPLAFINDRIILEAKRMLRYSDLMVKEIAYNLGYDDPSYFVKFFKRQTGYLPTDFREQEA